MQIGLPSISAILYNAENSGTTGVGSESGRGSDLQGWGQSRVLISFTILSESVHSKLVYTVKLQHMPVHTKVMIINYKTHGVSIHPNTDRLGQTKEPSTERFSESHKSLIKVTRINQGYCKQAYSLQVRLGEEVN